MARPWSAGNARTTRAEASRSPALWVLLIEEQGRPDHSLLRLLRKQMRADVASDPVVSYALAFEAIYDAIILDLPVDGVSGSIALCRALRVVGIEIPIVIMSARAPVADIVAGLNAGADAVIPMSENTEVLVARLGALQRRTERLISRGA
jgi:DNA-binding response OmpR family regulator